MALSSQELKAMNDRFFKEVINNRNFSLMEEFIAPEYIMHGAQPPVEGPDGFRQLGERVLATFPDVKFTVDDFVTDGNKTVVRWTAQGTQLGAFGTFEPTGKQVSWNGISLTRVDEQGKALEGWATENNFDLLLQIGVITKATPAQVPA